MKICLIILFLLSAQNAKPQDSCKCKSSFYYYDSTWNVLLMRVERNFINDSVLIVKNINPATTEFYVDSFKIKGGDLWLEFKGTYYPHFSKKGFEIGRPIQEYRINSVFNKVVTDSYYPIDKINTDTLDLYIYKLISHSWIGRELDEPMRVYYNPRIGVVRIELFDQKGLHKKGYSIVGYKEEDDCEEFFRDIDF